MSEPSRERKPNRSHAASWSSSASKRTLSSMSQVASSNDVRHTPQEPLVNPTNLHPDAETKMLSIAVNPRHELGH